MWTSRILECATIPSTTPRRACALQLFWQSAADAKKQSSKDLGMNSDSVATLHSTTLRLSEYLILRQSAKARVSPPCVKEVADLAMVHAESAHCANEIAARAARPNTIAASCKK